MRRFLLPPALLALFAAALLAPPAAAQPPADVKIPIVGRPTEDFYDAVGTGVKVRFQAQPTEVTVEDWLTLTLTVTGLQNPMAVRRPDLDKLPAFHKDFQVEDLPDPPAGGPNQRVFAYRLRPRGTDVARVPPLRFRYFNPRATAGDPRFAFPLTAADSVPIRVRPGQAPPPRPVGPLDVPAFAERVDPVDDVLSDSSGYGGVYLVLLGMFLAPVSALVWVLVWQARYPDAARLARVRQSRAARRALGELARLRRRGAEDGAAVADSLLRYLHERADLPAWARTPAEVADLLARAGLTAEAVAATREVLAACDAARFAPAPPAPSGRLAAGAERVVEMLEGAA